MQIKIQNQNQNQKNTVSKNLEIKVQNQNQNQKGVNGKRFDLENRVTQLAINIISCIKYIPQSLISNPLITQIVRSSTSIGANYMEANACNTKRDFINRIAIAKKEAKETEYWFSILISLHPNKAKELNRLKDETHEIVLILSSIINKVKLSPHFKE